VGQKNDERPPVGGSVSAAELLCFPFGSGASPRLVQGSSGSQ
jgi:hypothetical protein